MESDKEQRWFDTQKNHWKIIVARYYGVQGKILKVNQGDQIEIDIIQGPN
jgi:hypothetical protein